MPADELTPDHPETGKVTESETKAGGWPALGAGLKHIRAQRNTTATLKTLLKVNQPAGFDCPGCAWPEPDDPSRFEFCENGIKAVAWEATGKRVGPDFFAKHTVTELRAQTDHWLESQGRLTQPLRYHRATDKYEPVTWAQAFELVGDTLRGLDSPDRAVFYTSGRTSNEAAFLYQLFVRRFGTNNLPDCSNMCHESSGVALGETIGIGKGTVRLHDFEQADLILVTGQNPGTNHPRMLTELGKAAKRGCRIIAVNPLKEAGLLGFLHPQKPVAMLTNHATSIASMYLQPLVGGDLALFKGVCKHVLEAEEADPGGVLDAAFIEAHTVGLEALRADLAETGWEEIVEQSGVGREDIVALADAYMKAERVIACWAMGLTQHKHAVPTIQMVINLLLLRGNIGRPGAGACPVRGHSNVQGDRTMGIFEKPPPELMDGLRRVFGFEPPMEEGYDAVAAIHAMASGEAQVFIGMGGNFVSAAPDTGFVADALGRCRLTVQVSTKLNRSHTAVGTDALILPCLGRTETDLRPSGPQRVTVEDSMSQVHASMGRNTPASPELMSEPAIIAGMAVATLGDDGGGIDWQWLTDDYSRIRDKIADCLPDLFEGYNEKIQSPGGFYLGNSAADYDWKTASRKAQFTPAPIPDLSLPAGQLRLMTLRSHDQYNTTVYGMNDRYRGIAGTRKVVFMHAEDIAERGMQPDDLADLQSHFDDGRARGISGYRVVACDIPRGCAAGYFPEMNPLVSANSFADRSRTPTSKFIPVTVTRHDG
jgi:molybdopterin-dependent oxidoreductase alpha subunit